MDSTQIWNGAAGLNSRHYQSAYRVTEVEYVLNKVGCKALVTAARFKSSDYIGMLQELAPEQDCAPGDLQASKLPSLRAVIRTGDEETTA